MKIKKIIFVLCFLSINLNSLAISSPPKWEFRGVWIASVVNLDWPSSPYKTTTANITDLIYLLDELKHTGINAVVFQIRPECDALYESSYEPWSYWLTGEQGKAPDPYFDPLEIAIQEAHKRGMELHAWFNPYRAVREVGDYTIDAGHVSKEHPDWILRFGDLKILDPGLPMVREYVTNVVMDVVTRYDVDGVHFDDYFYPYPPNQITNEDDETFANYSRGFTDRGDWRRDNINLLVEMVYDSIKTSKPYVKFGISPFGIWKNGIPSGIYGLDAYNVIYSDAVAWLQRQIVDYLTPQLYWPFDGGQDYGTLMPWWASKTNGRHLYPGQAPYRIYSSNWSADELPNQIRLNRRTDNALGSVFFRAYHVISNPKGFTDSLKMNLYRNPAVPPTMNWLELTTPEAPQDLRYEILVSTETLGLQWEKPTVAADGDTAFGYVVYRFKDSDVTQADMEESNHIVALEGLNYNVPKNPSDRGPYYYGVTAIDRNSNESTMSGLTLITAPDVPMLAFPEDNSTDQMESVTLEWHPSDSATAYSIQVSLDSTFSQDFILDAENYPDISVTVTELAGQVTYYWRINASNAGGVSEFSDKRSFTTGFPAVPTLAYPKDNEIDVSVTPIIAWHETPGSDYYQVQVALSPRFNSLAMIVDTTGISDTTYALSHLDGETYYYWRVKAYNSLGISNWSDTYRFKTEKADLIVETGEGPRSFALAQNYPNPFRLDQGDFQTTIRYKLANESSVQVKLIIYNLMGQKIKTLKQESQRSGVYQVTWNGRNEQGELVSSGIYIYRLIAGSFQKTRKMLIVR